MLPRSANRSAMSTAASTAEDTNHPVTPFFRLHFIQKRVQFVNLLLWERLLPRHGADEHAQTSVVDPPQQVTRLPNSGMFAGDIGEKGTDAAGILIAHRALFY